MIVGLNRVLKPWQSFLILF